MSDKSKIEWTDSTWNPLRGVKGRHHCTKVSPGCANCYAERMNIRFGGPAYVHGADRLQLPRHVLIQPMRWQRSRKIFVCSMSDLFHEAVPVEFIDAIVAVMLVAQNHTFQILTKRADRMLEYFEDEEIEMRLSAALGNLLDGQWIHGAGRRWRQRIEDEISRALGEWCEDETPPADANRPLLPAPNMCLGASAENQEWFDKRVGAMTKLSEIGWSTWWSMEPLVGPILGDTGADWVVVGGESGPSARPMHPAWARSIRDQCQAAGVPFFFKQWGAWGPEWGLVRGVYVDPATGETDYPAMGPRGLPVANQDCMFRHGKKAAGRMLDGREWNEFPATMENSR